MRLGGALGGHWNKDESLVRRRYGIVHSQTDGDSLMDLSATGTRLLVSVDMQRVESEWMSSKRDF